MTTTIKQERSSTSMERLVFARLDYLLEQGRIELSSVDENRLTEYGLGTDISKDLIRLWRMNHNEESNYEIIRTS